MAANFENKYQGDKNAFNRCVRCSSGLFGSVNNKTISGMFITYSAQERCWNLASRDCSWREWLMRLLIDDPLEYLCQE